MITRAATVHEPHLRWRGTAILFPIQSQCGRDQPLSRATAFVNAVPNQSPRRILVPLWPSVSCTLQDDITGAVQLLLYVICVVFSSLLSAAWRVPSSGMQQPVEQLLVAPSSQCKSPSLHPLPTHWAWHLPQGQSRLQHAVLLEHQVRKEAVLQVRVGTELTQDGSQPLRLQI